MSPSTRQDQSRVPFPDRHDGRAFNAKFQSLVGQLLRQAVDARMAPENNQTFYHGHTWSQRRADGTEMTIEAKAHTAESLLKFDEILEGNLSAIPDQIRSILDQMEAAFYKSLFATVDEAVEHVGNVVDARDKTNPEAFLEAIQKIEFGVNRKGEVTRPELHLHPDVYPKFMKTLQDAGPEFQAEVDRVTSEKEAAALAREAERKARFKKRIDV